MYTAVVSFFRVPGVLLLLLLPVLLQLSFSAGLLLYCYCCWCCRCLAGRGEREKKQPCHHDPGAPTLTSVSQKILSRSPRPLPPPPPLLSPGARRMEKRRLSQQQQRGATHRTRPTAFTTCNGLERQATQAGSVPCFRIGSSLASRPAIVELKWERAIIVPHGILTILRITPDNTPAPTAFLRLGVFPATITSRAIGRRRERERDTHTH